MGNGWWRDTRRSDRRGWIQSSAKGDAGSRDGLREVVLNRTRSDPFYEGYYLQIVAGLGERAFADATPNRS